MFNTWTTLLSLTTDKFTIKKTERGTATEHVVLLSQSRIPNFFLSCPYSPFNLLPLSHTHTHSVPSHLSELEQTISLSFSWSKHTKHNATLLHQRSTHTKTAGEKRIDQFHSVYLRNVHVWSLYANMDYMPNTHACFYYHAHQTSHCGDIEHVCVSRPFEYVCVCLSSLCGCVSGRQGCLDNARICF